MLENKGRFNTMWTCACVEAKQGLEGYFFWACGFVLCVVGLSTLGIIFWGDGCVVTLTAIPHRYTGGDSCGREKENEITK